jgi:hypothetical protein
MVPTRVDLPFAGSRQSVALKEMNGSVEASVRGTGTRDAIALVDQLLAEEPTHAAGPGTGAALTAADRDRVLATVYAQIYGPQVRNTVTCPGCAAAFDMDFLLPDLLASLPTPAGGDRQERDEHGVLVTDDGVRFRLPTGMEECSVMGMDTAEAVRKLAALCLLDDDGARADVSAIQEAMAAAAPILDLDLGARCPECGLEHVVRFDMQHYLLSRLMGEHRLLAVEVHTLARAYSWSFTEIMGMPRNLRKTFAGIINGSAGGWWV